MKLLIFFICILHFVSKGDCKHSKKGKHVHDAWRVMQGEEVPIVEYPYAVRIEDYNFSTPDEWAPRCGGSILTPSTILTACHCLLDETGYRFMNPKFIRITAGIGDFSKGTVETGQVVLVKYPVPHPHCKKARDANRKWLNTYKNDVGVFILKNPLKLNEKVQLLKVFSNDAKMAHEELERLIREKTQCETVGWGYFIEGLEMMSPMLMLSKPHLITSKVCSNDKCSHDKSYCNYSFDQNNQMCAVDQNSSVCLGDSGGPLVCNGYLFGVTSYGCKGCTVGADRPSVYSNINLILYFYNRYVK